MCIIYAQAKLLAKDASKKAPPKITDGDVPDMAVELREDMKEIKAQLTQLNDVKEQLSELKVINEQLSNLQKGFFWIRSPKRTTPP